MPILADILSRRTQAKMIMENINNRLPIRPPFYRKPTQAALHRLDLYFTYSSFSFCRL